MPKEYINPKELFPSVQYGFSQIITNVGGKMVFFSGQTGWNEQQQIAGLNDLRAQVWETFRNIEKAIQAAGGALTDIVSMRIYIVGEKYEEDHHITEALKAFFPKENAPTTTWIRVLGLARKEFLIEIEPIAIIEH